MTMLTINIYRALIAWQALLPDHQLSILIFQVVFNFFLDLSRFPFKLPKQFWSL